MRRLLAWVKTARSRGFIPTLVRIPVPSWGLRQPRRRIRLIAVVPVRDEIDSLPAFVRTLAPQVDGIVAYDDASSDGSGEWLNSVPEVIEVVRAPADRARWNEGPIRRALVDAALRQGAEWILWTAVDIRVEREFRARAERVIRRGRRLGYSAYALRLRELWDSPEQYRSDGVWDQKWRPWLFRARSNHAFDDRELHSIMAPLQAKVLNAYPRADLVLYHLGSVQPVDREARRRKYEAIDPDARWQPRGYAYLTDETGLELKPVPRSRSFQD